MKAVLRRLWPASAPSSKFDIRSIGRTHVGKIRTVNEDRVLERSDLCLWAVADGMGGLSRGDVAAETVTSCLGNLEAPIEAYQIVQVLEQANRQIYDKSGGRSGTTLALLSIDDRNATLRWAGDSRAYLIRDGRLTLLTRDHSVVQQLMDAGALTPAQAARHPQSNVITRAIGTGPRLELECTSIELQAGDRLLLCSDGLSRTLTERDIHGRLSIAALADRLLANSLARDGSDNISLVLVEASGAA